METLKFKTRYVGNQARRHSYSSDEPSMCQQQFKEECDVNNILLKYRKTGMLTHIQKHGGNFGDFDSVGDYQFCLEKLMQAQRSFDQLPSELRTRFANDPAQLIQYLENKENHPEAVKLGLMVKRKVEPDLQASMEKALEKNDEKRAKKQQQEKK